MTVDPKAGSPALTLSLSEGNNGTFLTSTRSLRYGRVTARMRPLAAAGVLTSFSLMSGTDDEILYECVLKVVVDRLALTLIHSTLLKVHHECFQRSAHGILFPRRR